MKVAILSTSSWRTPPRKYGPSELFASMLTEELVRLGHEVTLFATRDSHTAAKLESVLPTGTEEDKYEGSGEIHKDASKWQLLHVANCMEKAEEFDIIHNNMDYLPLFFTPLVKTPMVTTVHAGLIEFQQSRTNLEIYKKYNSINHYVSISNAARHEDINYAETVYHGTDLSLLPFKPDKGDYLLFFGRVDHAKGALEAIETAREFGMKLILAGIVPDKEYFEIKLKPHLDSVHAEYVGVVGGEERVRLLQGAYALLHMINFDEPFGLSLIEAMACGTPVVAMNRGSMPEIIDDGRTGFVVNSLSEAVESLGKVGKLDRNNCRAWVEEHFSKEIMADNYLKLYEKLIHPASAE